MPRLVLLTTAALISLTLCAYAADSPAPLLNSNAASPHIQQALWGSTVVEVDPWSLQDHWQYRAELLLYKAGEITSKLGVDMADGSTGTLAYSNEVFRRQDDGTAKSFSQYYMLFSGHAAGEPNPRSQPRELTAVQQQCLQAGQQFAYGPISFQLYAPGADSFEVRVYRQFLPASDVAPSGELLPSLIKHDPLPEEYIGWVGGVIETSDTKFAELRPPNQRD